MNRKTLQLQESLVIICKMRSTTSKPQGGSENSKMSGVRFCNSCERFDGSICHGGMKSCWKFNLYSKNRSCATDHYYFSDLTTGRYLFRYTTLSCRPCDEGMFQVFHDLLRETTCCINENRVWSPPLPKKRSRSLRALHKRELVPLKELIPEWRVRL
ncbi:prostate and testis expressed protein 13-like isoform X2 [Macaca nemestrina]|uniref:prostate and testis expressed protein 13-like isoform X2 n=1 Tax=Macaca nemestrina TaxID=9545 RepID=UPI0039B87F74